MSSKIKKIFLFPL